MDTRLEELGESLQHGAQTTRPFAAALSVDHLQGKCLELFLPDAEGFAHSVQSAKSSWSGARGTGCRLAVCEALR